MFRKLNALVLMLSLVIVGLPTVAMGEELAEEPSPVWRAEAGEYAPGEAIVVMKDSNASEDVAVGGFPLYDYEMEDLMTVKLPVASDGESDFPLDGASPDYPLGGISPDGSADEAESVGEIRLVRSETLDTEELINVLEKRSDVISAEPNYIATIEAIPDFTSEQYFANSEYGIDVPNWNDPSAPKNADGIIVAVLDSGVDYRHEDLKDIMWADGDKYPELVAYGGGTYGYNAVAAEGGETNFDVSDPMDDHRHGTHCAGIIAGQWNDYGISGIANGPRIMAVKGLGSNGAGTLAGLIGGLNYIKLAMDAGVDVKVVNNSWGVHANSKGISLAVNEVAKRGAILLFASSNEGSDSEKTPEVYGGLRGIPNVVVVNATDKNGDYAYFTNYGKNNTDVAAPGVGIMSTVPYEKATASSTYSRTLLENDFDDKQTSFLNYTAGTEATSLTTVASRSGNALELESYDANSKAAVTFTGLDLSTYRPKYLTYSVSADMLSSVETAAFIEDGHGMSTGMVVGTITPETGDDNWGECSVVIPELSDYSDVSITIFFATASPDVHKFVIDDITATNDALAYAPMSGTSMATPAVAGEAAILVAQFPNDSPEKIAARIIGSVKRYDAQKDKCISGGIANLRYALEEKTAPVLFSAETKQNQIKISGYFFGSESGTVTIDGVNATVSSWTDTEITVAIPENFESGYKLVEVRKPSGTEGLLDGHRQFLLDESLASSYTMIDTKEIDNLTVESMVTANGKIYMLASDESQLEGYAAFYEYNPVSGHYNRILEMEEAQVASNLTVFNGHVIALLADAQYKKPTHVLVDYNPYDGKLEQKNLRFLPDSRVGMMLMVQDGKLLAAGGMGTAIFADIYEVFVDGTTPVLVGNLCQPRAQGGVFFYNGENYLAYGTNAALRPDYSIEKIKRVGDAYTSSVVISSAVPEGVQTTLAAEATVVSYEDGAIITGLCRLTDKNTVAADTYYLKFTETGYELIEDNNIFSSTKMTLPKATICNGKYYVSARLQAVDTQLLFGFREGLKDVKSPEDKLPEGSEDVKPDDKDKLPEENTIETKVVGDLVVTYDRCVEFDGKACKANRLNIKVVNSKTAKEYQIGSVRYKNNKNAGTARFTINSLKVSKEEKALKKALAKTPMEFTIVKAKLSAENTEVAKNKKGAVTAVKYLVKTYDKKGKLKIKKYTVPKKEYTVENGRIAIKETSKNYQGEFEIK